MSTDPSADSPISRLLADLPEVSPAELATWSDADRDAYLAARDALARELTALTPRKLGAADILADLRRRTTEAQAAKEREARRTAADTVWDDVLARYGDTNCVRIDRRDGSAVIVRTPTADEVRELETKIIRLEQQSDRVKAQAEIAQAQRWAWEKCIVYPKALGELDSSPLIWGDIRNAYNYLGRGVEDIRRGKS